MLQEIFLGIFLTFAIFTLIHIIGVVSDGRFMDWTDYFKKKLKLDNFTAGETIQALGTSAPEIAINFIGLYIIGTNPELGLATIIGSAIFQITVVIGIPLFYAPKSTTIEYKGLLRTSFIYGVSVLLLYVFLMNDQILSGIELTGLALYHISYVTYIIRGHKTAHEEDIEESHPEEPLSKPWILKQLNSLLNKIPAPGDKHAFIGKIPFGFLVTLFIIAVACYFFIETSVYFAQDILGVSIGLIGLTILAGGSSVPELFSNIPLAKKGNIDQAIGNAFGSNTLDICISFAFISIPYAFLSESGGVSGKNVEEMMIPIYFLFGYLFIVLGMFALSKFKTYQWQGYVLNALFIIFVVVSYFNMK